ncbi:hypothetical protein Maes01_00779 [Microbulbifer aestuariivivens]|uniref:Porin family protein n=1 Tax=Microbulbifer aestuariivivens TaxID=1908308 RepID=A0ABP9WLZ1_9GAMM
MAILKKLQPALLAAGLIILPAALLATPLAAQTIFDTGSVYQSSWGVQGESITINSDTAQFNGIGDSGFGIGGSYNGQQGLLNFSVGVTLFFIDDEAQFSQGVQNNLTGDQSTEKSSIDAGSLYVDGGIVYPFSERLQAGVNLGWRYFDVERGISNCSDCYSESVGIDSDTYIKPFARFSFNERYSGSLAYYSYTGDRGMENSVQFSFEFRR